LVIVSPGLQPFSLLSGRNSTYADVQISWASSDRRSTINGRLGLYSNWTFAVALNLG
jgi:hypothetical protein